VRNRLREFCKDDTAQFWESWLQNKSGDIDFSTLPEELPKFVFIIDEINRAEISKVLGELMYALEPDYRGMQGKVKTQYAYLATAETFFVSTESDFFFVPSNVYLIGTMNDIDQSVDTVGFALRRRFVWHEMQAEKHWCQLVLHGMFRNTPTLSDKIDDLIQRLENLNQVIAQKSGLGPHYRVGPSYLGKMHIYFRDGSDYEKACERLWNYHLAPLLTEYARLTTHAHDFLAQCQRGFLSAPVLDERG
jgi:5-methylcytosine-specific restriction protein B